MKTSTIRALRVGWSRLWLLRLYQKLLQTPNVKPSVLEEIQLGLVQLRVQFGPTDNKKSPTSQSPDATLSLAKVQSLLKRRQLKLGQPGESEQSADSSINRHPLFAELARVFALSGLQSQILALSCLLHVDDLLYTAAVLGERYCGTRHGAVRLLSEVLGVRAIEVRRALRHRGELVGSGLLQYYSGRYGSPTDVLEPGSGLTEQVSEDAADARGYLQQRFEAASAPSLRLDHFPHLAPTLARICACLTAKQHEGRAAQILLYGPPGTGKSELARVLAKECGLELFMVRSADEDGDPIHQSARLQAFDAAQRALRQNPRALLLFDEIEDVLARDGRSAQTPEGNVRFKSWINRTLETASVPTLWVGNSVAAFDASQLRRFDIAQLIDAPPRQVRRALLAGSMHQLAPELLDQIAAHPGFAPAHFVRAARLLERLAPTEPRAAEAIVRDSLNEILRMQGEALLRTTRPSAAFELEFLRTDQPIAPIVDWLQSQAQPCARLCLYGPPGTGKTALAAHLAEKLGRPLLLRRAADLLSKWLGETEAAIAQMFHDAQRDQAVLCLDEADGFLSDRGGAQHSWELTQVNELLTRLEDFEGVFVASTNLFERLDPAALRRFDFKLRFDWLAPAQRRLLFQRWCLRLHLSADLAEKERDQRLERLEQLAPGDFAAVVRRVQVAANAGRDGPPAPGAGAGWSVLLQALEAEVALKPGARRRIGFAA